jgi:hypothetical protein
MPDARCQRVRRSEGKKVRGAEDIRRSEARGQRSEVRGPEPGTFEPLNTYRVIKPWIKTK